MQERIKVFLSLFSIVSAVTTYNTRRRTSREHYKKIWREKGVCSSTCCEPHKTLNLSPAKSFSTVSILEKLKSDGSNDVNPITHSLMFGELRLRDVGFRVYAGRCLDSWSSKSGEKEKEGKVASFEIFFVANAHFLLEAHVSAERSVQFFSTERTYS
jgi:hypothetical protein